jgi:hypothetical protein
MCKTGQKLGQINVNYQPNLTEFWFRLRFFSLTPAELGLREGRERMCLRQFKMFMPAYI